MTKLLAARQIVTSMVTGILLWCVIGIGVSVLVSATLVLGYALFIVKDALAPAALSGAVKGLWLSLARNRWSGKKELVWFGIISGAALGLLLRPHTSRLRLLLAWVTSSRSSILPLRARHQRAMCTPKIRSPS